MRTSTIAIVLLLACSSDNVTPEQSSADTSDAGSSSPTGSASEPTGSASDPTGSATSGPANTSAASTGIATSSGAGTGPTSTGDLTTGTTTGGPMGTGVYARYEMRDNTDTPVDIWAYPACGTGDCYVDDFGPGVFPCALVSHVGQDRIGFQFELATGDPEGCYQNYASWADVPGASYFQDDGCTQQPIATPTALVDGTLYYSSVVENGITPATYYLRSGMNCFPIENPTGAVLGVPTPVPASVLGALPDAPYTISIAY